MRQFRLKSSYRTYEAAKDAALNAASRFDCPYTILLKEGSSKEYRVLKKELVDPGYGYHGREYVYYGTWGVKEVVNPSYNKGGDIQVTLTRDEWDLVKALIDISDDDSLSERTPIYTTLWNKLKGI
jgi:hypothetical protein